MHAWPPGGVRMGLQSTWTPPPPASIQLIAKPLDTEGKTKAGEGNRLAQDGVWRSQADGSSGP